MRNQPISLASKVAYTSFALAIIKTIDYALTLSGKGWGDLFTYVLNGGN